MPFSWAGKEHSGQASAEQKEQSERKLQELRQKLTDATTRELTIAQQTNKGRIYIISNVGSFGEGVYKIGLTRRLAQERVDELSSASVPFKFDIHAVIETDNAPALEYKQLKAISWDENKQDKSPQRIFPGEFG
jgi:hypothetical protein